MPKSEFIYWLMSSNVGGKSHHNLKLIRLKNWSSLKKLLLFPTRFIKLVQQKNLSKFFWKEIKKETLYSSNQQWRVFKTWCPAFLPSYVGLRSIIQFQLNSFQFVVWARWQRLVQNTPQSRILLPLPTAYWKQLFCLNRYSSRFSTCRITSEPVFLSW